MDLWATVGSLWDQAYDGDAGGAAARAKSISSEAATAAERAVLTGAIVLCEVLLCRYVDATRTAMAAALEADRAEGEAGEDARFYTASLRLLAAAMLEPSTDQPEPALPLPAFDDLQSFAASLPRSRPERLLLAQPLVEASMSMGLFAEVDAAVSRLRPWTEADREQSELVRYGLDVLAIRSLAFRGHLDAVVEEAEALLAEPGVAGHPQVTMITEALLCYAAAQRADRKEVERLSASVLAEARSSANYIATGSCLLVSWSFQAIGQIQRAAALLVAASGGPGLPRIKTWDRAFGYELLATAALRREDLAAARGWADRAAPLASRSVAAAAVERTLSRVATATGDPIGAALRASVSAGLDTRSGAQLESLRARMLYADALAVSGEGERAMEILTEIARDADRLGATAIRKQAAREWRMLARQKLSPGGGFASLSDREREIAVLVAEGHTNRSIGHTLFLSERTVQTHLSHILRVMGLPSRTAIPAALATDGGPTSAPALTQRQEQIARLVAAGARNSLIAEELGISVKTVENHLAGIFARWQVSSRTAVAHLYVARDRAELAR